MAREEVKSKLGLPPKSFALVIERMVEEGQLAEQSSSLRLADHSVQFTAEQQKRIDDLFKVLGDSPFSPPSVSELQQQFGLEDDVVNALIAQKKLVKVGEGLVFSPEIYDEMVRRVVDHLKANGNVTVGEVRDMFGSSRKYVLALLEHLDDQKITRRVGDERVLRR
ncbi:MAG: SelB C-terminal domain-containing protein [Dehalococcoidales bacterium]|nr:SelB C-terminal domain-containing protein [Dehalococcoidales bacterium]